MSRVTFKVSLNLNECAAREICCASFEVEVQLAVRERPFRVSTAEIEIGG